MVQYRRNKIKGGTYFFTVTLKDRQSDMLCQNISLLRKAFKITRNKYPFIIDAIVILPNREYSQLWLKPAIMATFKRKISSKCAAPTKTYSRII